MKRSFTLLMLISFSLLVFGCGTPPVRIASPIAPPIPRIYIGEGLIYNEAFRPPVPMNLTFREKTGTDSKTTDNVVVRVASITDSLEDAEYTTTIEGPDGQQYTYSLFPMMLVLELTNNTDHIIRLTRTIIQIEDEDQREYPLINTFKQNKKRLASEIGKAFDEYVKATKLHVDRKKLEEKYFAIYKRSVYESSYPDEYRNYIEVLKASGEKDLELISETFEPSSIVSLGQARISAEIDSKIYKIKSGSLLSEQRKSEIEELKQNAINQIMAIPNVTNLITAGEYPPISILPGRTKKLIAPISKRFDDENINSVIVNVFDLPTKVDAAGNPTKRANFKFHLVAERI